MGRTPKPLEIWADSSLLENPELLKLRDQGHSIIFLESSPDLIMGPNCWRIVDGLQQYIPIAVNAARKHRYPTKKGSVSNE